MSCNEFRFSASSPSQVTLKPKTCCHRTGDRPRRLRMSMRLTQRIHRRFLVNSSIMNTDLDRQRLAREAKQSLPVFRNGAIEDIHAGRPCPTCTGQAGYSRITDAEMKSIIKNAVDHVYALLVLKNEAPKEYESQIRLGERYTRTWDEPAMPEGHKARSEPLPR